MNKAKQIYEILFPNGILYTYIPSGFFFLLSIYNLTQYYLHGGSDLVLLIDCLSIGLSLSVFGTCRKLRATVAKHDRFIQEVLQTVAPDLQKLHDEMLNDLETMTTKDIFALTEKSYAIIDAELVRRKNLERVSSSDKT